MYIDPNAGGMLFQVLAVMFGLLSGFVLFFSGRIRMTVARLRRSRREQAEDADGEEDSASLAETDLQ